MKGEKHMDLYESLKNGSSENELKETFNKDLPLARACIAKEKEKTSKQETAKKNLSKGFTEYSDTNNVSFDKEYSVTDLIKIFTDTMNSFLSLTDTNTDDDIIFRFIKTL